VTLTKEYLETGVPAISLVGPSGLLGALAGIPVVEVEELAYDEMAFDRVHQRLEVGDQRHFIWRMKQIDLNAEVRAKAIARIRASARKMLGDEDWKLSPK